MDPNNKNLHRLADLLRAISHPVRLCIVMGLVEKGECNVSHMQNCLDSPQSTVSQHLQKLRAAGVISARRQGLEVFYQIADQRVLKILKTIEADWPSEAGR